jgi:glycosyltransferase involved in cell wall biosynthesis
LFCAPLLQGWALPLTEAMALEVPVLATNHSGPSCYLTPHNSWPLPLAFEHTDGSGEPSVAALVNGLQILYGEWRTARTKQHNGGGSSKSSSRSTSSGWSSSSGSGSSGSSGSGGSPTEAGLLLVPPPREVPRVGAEARHRGAQARRDVVGRFSGDVVAARMVTRLSALLRKKARQKATDSNVADGSIDFSSSSGQ